MKSKLNKFSEINDVYTSRKVYVDHLDVLISCDLFRRLVIFLDVLELIKGMPFNCWTLFMNYSV